MGRDDDSDCPEHVWRFAGAQLGPGAVTTTEYVCERCPAVLLVGPGGTHPPTA